MGLVSLARLSSRSQGKCAGGGVRPRGKFLTPFVSHAVLLRSRREPCSSLSVGGGVAQYLIHVQQLRDVDDATVSFLVPTQKNSGKAHEQRS